MYGKLTIPVEMKVGDATISITERKGGYHYSRTGPGGESVEKVILSDDTEFLLAPVEPVNLPGRVATHLYLDLKRNLVTGPRGVSKIYLTFPVEICVFAFRAGSYKEVDLFTLSRQKLAMYGQNRRGYICKYWKTEFHMDIPKVDPLREGVLSLKLVDRTEEDWEEVQKVVFNAYGMKVFYSDQMVCMRSMMELTGQHIAETAFKNAPIVEGMKRSPELYNLSKLKISLVKFIMEAGL